MKKQLLIVGSYPSEQKTEQVLQSVLERVNNDFDVLLVTHCPVSKEIQNMVKYFIYDCRNDFIPSNPNVNFYADYPKFFFRIYQLANHKNHSYAVFRSIMNAVNFAKDSYDSFVYVEGDCLFSEQDVIKLKNLKNISETNNKKAMFLKFDYVFVSTIFYSSIEFFKNTFKFSNSSDEYIINCKEVGAYGTLESFLYKSVERKKLFGDVHMLENIGIEKYFATSKHGMSAFAEDGIVTDMVGISTVLKIENTTDIAFVYLNKSPRADKLEVYVDDVLCETIPNSLTGMVFKINPKNQEFVVRISDARLIKFNKNSILDPKNRSFVRLK
jgi:hypothetical protein